MGHGWVLIPVISACMGWLANRAVIWSLFHPHEPKKLLGFTIQGIFAKNHRAWAGNLAKLVSRELVSFRDIEEKFTHPTQVKRIMPQVEEHIDNFLRIKLPAQMPVISMFIGDKTIQELKTIFTAEMEELFPIVMKNYLDGFRDEPGLEKIVADRINRFSIVKLEEMFIKYLSRELRLFEFIGAGLGFLMGALLVLLNAWLLLPT